MACCIRCGSENASPRIYEDYQGNKTPPIYHCDPCARNAYSYFRREARDHERAREVTKKQKEQAEQARKDREYKLSHCQQCGKKSSLYHYIYDKRTKRLSSSTSNATDADNQIVFCSESHYKSWLKGKLNEIYRKNRQDNAELERNQERLEELITERAELQRKLDEELEKETPPLICAKCSQNITGRHWTNKNDYNAFCSESCYDNYYSDNECDDCGKQITGRSFYADSEKQTGTLCQDCCEKQILGQKTNSSSPSTYSPSNNSPSTPVSNYQDKIFSPPQQSKNSQTDIKCYNCKKSINQGENTNYLSQAPDKKWCETCDPEVKTCFQATQQIFAGQIIDVDKLNISKENKIELLIITKLKNGEPVDIDKFHIDQESKAGLKEIQNQFEQGKIPTNKKPNEGCKYNSVCLDCKKEFSYKFKAPSQCQACHSKKIKIYDAQGFLQQINSPQPFYAKVSFWIEIVLAVIGIIWTVYQISRWRKAKRAGKKYNWWTNKIS